MFKDIISDGNIYIEAGGRSFKILKIGKHGYSYAMDKEEINILTDEFKRLGIKYTMQTQGQCIIAGCPENPAKYKVDFKIGEQEYTIKNYNGYLLEREAVEQIKETLGKNIKLVSNPPITAATPPRRSNQEFETYTGRETAFVFDTGSVPKEPTRQNQINKPTEQSAAATQNKMEDNKKLPKAEEQGKWVQISIWDIMYNRQ